jgi:hypothetical protein
MKIRIPDTDYSEEIQQTKEIAFQLLNLKFAIQ